MELDGVKNAYRRVSNLYSPQAYRISGPYKFDIAIRFGLIDCINKSVLSVLVENVVISFRNGCKKDGCCELSRVVKMVELPLFEDTCVTAELLESQHAKATFCL